MNIDQIISFFKEFPFLLFYLSAFVLSVYRYPKYYNSPLKFFPIILLYTLVTETLGGFILSFKEFSFYLNDFYHNNNHLIFNIYGIITSLYLFYIFYKFIHSKAYKKYIIYGTILYLIGSIINALYSSFIYELQILADSIGGGILIICIGLYFKHRKKQNLPYFGSRDILSWIGLGYATFFVGYLPLTFCRYNIYNFGRASEPTFFKPLHFALIMIMYSCIIIGFLRMRRLKPPSY